MKSARTAAAVIAALAATVTSVAAMAADTPGIILLAVAYRNRTPSGNIKVSPAAPPRS